MKPLLVKNNNGHDKRIGVWVSTTGNEENTYATVVREDGSVTDWNIDNITVITSIYPFTCPVAALKDYIERIN